MHLCGTLLLILIIAAHDAVHAGRIYGGRKAHGRPYMALVERHMGDGKPKYCGGFLLRDNFVMTAAHCSASSYSVFLGIHDALKKSEAQHISVEKAFMNPIYDDKTLKNDLLLLKLSSKAKLNSKVACISLARPEDEEPKDCSLAGWGRTEHSKGYNSHTLMEVNVSVSQCESPKQGDYFYCVNGKKGGQSGDSGGPLVCEKEKVYGVVSGRTEAVQYYSKIPIHQKWINRIMNSQ
ncbi:unnamed protein product [Knipowitschia caucasica]|uniref:trypsin n=1 Tax=Knipowitschia caucasica TaxID=637954 RepID=A0AAV2KXA4_KNICA